jgi:hypothetical protein
MYVTEHGEYMGIHPQYRMEGMAVYGSCYVSIMGLGA